MKNQYDDLKKEFQDTVAELSKITGWPQEQSKHVLELLASFTAKKAGQEAEKERVQRKYAKVDATKNLLKNYRRLKLSIECGTEHTLMLLADAEYQRLMEMEESVQNQRLRSTALWTSGNRVLWARLNAALECFKEMCGHDPSPRVQRQYALIFEKYIAEPEHADLEDEDQTIIIRRKGGLLIRKTSEDDFVEGISFIVAGEGYEETFVTDKQGQIYVQDLVPGEYTVTEVENDVTAKYIIEAGKTVTITSGDEPAEVEFHNKLKRGSVYVVKTAEGAPDTNLPGAEFTVYADVDGNAEFDPETDILFGKLEYAEESYSLDGLTMGGYFLHEEKAPEGYAADDGYYYFKLAEDGKRVEVTNTADKEAGFVNEKQTGSLRIVKVEQGTDKPLKGATFCVKDENGEAVTEGKTDKDGVIVFEDLPFGSYIYQEVYAPEGYKLDDTEHKFEINTENIQVEVTAENEKIPTTPSNDVPKTGDTRPHPWLIGGVALLMLACAGRLFWYLLKHRRA